MVGQNLGKRLVREFQRGGKKSIVLALLLAVGLCIWGPMLWRKIVGKKEATATAAPASRTSGKKYLAPAQNAAPTTPIPSVEWKSLYRRIAESSLVHPVSLDEIVRDPFDRAWIGEKQQPVVTKPEPEIPAPRDPIRSLVLSAILAGAEGGAVVINDGVYRIGQQVPERGPIRYVLKEIRQDRVLLERAGKLEELPLADAEVASPGPLNQEP